MIKPCIHCGETPQIIWTGFENRVIHANPCQLQGNFSVAEYNDLNTLKIELPEEEDATSSN